MIMWWVQKICNSHFDHNFITMLWKHLTTDFSPIYFSSVHHITMKKWWKCDELILVLFVIWNFPPCCSTQWWMKKLSLKQKNDNLNGPIVLLWLAQKSGDPVAWRRVIVCFLLAWWSRQKWFEKHNFVSYSVCCHAGQYAMLGSNTLIRRIYSTWTHSYLAH